MINDVFESVGESGFRYYVSLRHVREVMHRSDNGQMYVSTGGSESDDTTIRKEDVTAFLEAWRSYMFRNTIRIAEGWEKFWTAFDEWAASLPEADEATLHPTAKKLLEAAQGRRLDS